MKTKYYKIGFDQGGYVDVSFWKSLTDDEADDLIDEHGSLEGACGYQPDIQYNIMSESDLNQMKKDIEKALR